MVFIWWWWPHLSAMTATSPWVKLPSNEITIPGHVNYSCRGKWPTLSLQQTPLSHCCLHQGTHIVKCTRGLCHCFFSFSKKPGTCTYFGIFIYFYKFSGLSWLVSESFFQLDYSHSTVVQSLFLNFNIPNLLFHFKGSHSFLDPSLFYNNRNHREECYTVMMLPWNLVQV